MIDINLGKNKSIGIDRLAQVLLKENLRSQIMMMVVLKRLEEIKASVNDEEFEIKKLEELLYKIDRRADRKYTKFVDELVKGPK